MPKLTPVQKQQRVDFVLQRLKRGLSFAETQKQFVREFQVQTETARYWTNWACEQIANTEDQQERKRLHATIVEMYHDQIVAFQTEILAMQREIDTVGALLDRRAALLAELALAAGGRRRELVDELGAIGSVSPVMKANLIEAKTRIRERMQRVIWELARLRGFTSGQSDWKALLNAMLDNNLIPPAIASGILETLDRFESRIQAIDVAGSWDATDSSDSSDSSE